MDPLCRCNRVDWPTDWQLGSLVMVEPFRHHGCAYISNLTNIQEGLEGGVNWKIVSTYEPKIVLTNSP
eukprot:5855378-Pyramimonas_sp.AAC.1